VQYWPAVCLKISPVGVDRGTGMKLAASVSDNRILKGRVLKWPVMDMRFAKFLGAHDVCQAPGG
jgi:hypothetical protein